MTAGRPITEHRGQQDVAEILGIARQRVQESEKRALAKLREILGCADNWLPDNRRWVYVGRWNGRKLLAERQG